MNDTFEVDEKLYRAIYPPEIRSMFWKDNGTVSSAAFYDAKGCSVDRGDFREDYEVVLDMKSRFKGRIVSVTVGECEAVKAKVIYKPSKNPFHSEIHGSDSDIVLSRSQRRHIACKAKIVSL